MNMKRTQFHKDSVGKLVQGQQRSTSPTNKPSTLAWKSKVEADPPSEISSRVTKKSQVDNNSTGQLVQSPKSRTRSNRNRSTSVQRSRVQANMPSEIDSPSVQRSPIQVNSSSRPSSTATKKTHLQKESTVQVNSSSKPSPTATKKTHSQKESTFRVNASSKPSQTANKETHFQKYSSPQKVWREKTKKQPSSSEPERPRNLAPTSPMYHITWDGFVGTCESATENCLICEREFSSSVNREFEDYDEYSNDLEPEILPEVAVLACGHVFHPECLDSCTPEDQSSDPPCFICLSICP